MKRTLAILLVLATICALSACSEHVYDAEPKVFTTSGITLTLTEAFQERGMERYTACFSSEEVAVFVTKEKAINVDEITLQEYAAMVRHSNLDRTPGEVKEIDGLTTLEYSFYNESSKATYCYFLSMYEGKTAYWLVQFACEDTLYEDCRPYFIEWAKSVQVEKAGVETTAQS